MLYKDVFDKLTNYDLLTFEYQDLDDALKKELLKNSEYLKFVTSKIAFRKQLERAYSSRYKGDISFKSFIDQLTKIDASNTRNILYSNFSNEEINEIKAKIDFFFIERNQSITKIEKDIETYPFIKTFLSRHYLEPYFLGCKLLGMKSLYNNQISLLIKIALNKKSKEIIENHLIEDKISSLIDDSMDKHTIMSFMFENPKIYYRDKLLFSSVTHSGYYFFND